MLHFPKKQSTKLLPKQTESWWEAGSLYFPDTIERDAEDYLKVHGPKSIVKGRSLLLLQHKPKH